MDLTETEEMIKRHEGYEPSVYKCTRGVLTCGWGHALHEGSTVPLAASLRFFDQDFRQVLNDYEKLKLDLDDTRRAVILDMLFNLGLRGVRRFKKMMRAIRKRDWEKAADELLDSKYAKQVKGRGLELASLLLNGDTG